MSNTEQLIKDLKDAQSFGINSVVFRVGKYTGNNPSVVAALKKRGFNVERVPGGSYKLSAA